MNLIQKLRESRVLKIIFSMILLIIIFDKLLLLCLMTVYYLVQKYVLKNEVKSPLYYIKKYTDSEYSEKYKNDDKYLNFGKELYTNLESSIFEPSGNIAHNLGSIFKNSELNLNAYPNVEIKPGQRLFQDNKFLPECCFYHSQYSTDKGCPCITPGQQYYLQRRGLNKHPDSFIQDNKDYKNLFFSPSMALKGETMPFNQNAVYFLRDEPPLSEISKNYVRSILNEQER